MIHYHGLPITPQTAAVEAIKGGHAFVSFVSQEQLNIAAELCQSFAVDNGAFSFWQKGEPKTDWSDYYTWALNVERIPNSDFAVIPDIIDGSEADNDALIAEWPTKPAFGCPVWHMHESLDRLVRLGLDWNKVAIGSSGEFSKVNSKEWWGRMAQAMDAVCDRGGRPFVKLHGLRMLNPRVFSRLPFHSADSTNIGRNIGIDKKWTKGHYLPPPTREARAAVMRQRIEHHQAAQTWEFPK